MIPYTGCVSIPKRLIKVLGFSAMRIMRWESGEGESSVGIKSSELPDLVVLMVDVVREPRLGYVVRLG